jgi:hypothetical protein
MEHLNGPFDKFIRSLVRAALNILVNQLFNFGFQVNRHKIDQCGRARSTSSSQEDASARQVPLFRQPGTI